MSKFRKEVYEVKLRLQLAEAQKALDAERALRADVAANYLDAQKHIGSLMSQLATLQAQVKALEHDRDSWFHIAQDKNSLLDAVRDSAKAQIDTLQAQLRQVRELVEAALLFTNKMPGLLHQDHSFDWAQGYQSALYDVQRILISDPEAMKRVATQAAQDAGKGVPSE